MVLWDDAPSRKAATDADNGTDAVVDADAWPNVLLSVPHILPLTHCLES